MTLAQISAFVCAALSLLCTTALGLFAFFIKRTISQFEKSDERTAALLDEMDKRHTEAMQEIDRRHTQALKELEREFSDLKGDLPLVYTLREDFIRTMNNVDRNFTAVDGKLTTVGEKLDKILGSIAGPQKGGQ